MVKTHLIVSFCAAINCQKALFEQTIFSVNLEKYQMHGAFLSHSQGDEDFTFFST